MSNDKGRTALAAMENKCVRDRSTRTRPRQLSALRHTAFPRSTSRRSASTKLAFAVYGHSAVRVHAGAGAGRPTVRGVRVCFLGLRVCFLGVRVCLAVISLAAISLVAVGLVALGLEGRDAGPQDVRQVGGLLLATPGAPGRPGGTALPVAISIKDGPGVAVSLDFRSRACCNPSRSQTHKSRYRSSGSFCCAQNRVRMTKRRRC